MPKFDKYFDDLTSCSLISFLEHKLPTDKKKAYSLYKGTLSSIAKDVNTEQDRRVTARACMDAFKVLFLSYCFLCYVNMSCAIVLSHPLPIDLSFREGHLFDLCVKPMS